MTSPGRRPSRARCKVHALGSALDLKVDLGRRHGLRAAALHARPTRVVDPATVRFRRPGCAARPRHRHLAAAREGGDRRSWASEKRVGGEVVREVTAQIPGDLVEQILTSKDPSKPVQARFSDRDRSRRAAAGRADRAVLLRAGQDATFTVELSDFGADVHDHRAAHRLTRRPRPAARRRPGAAGRRPRHARRPRHCGRHLRRRPGAARHPHRGRGRARRAAAGDADHRRLPARLHRHPAAARPARRPARPRAGPRRLPAAVRVGSLLTATADGLGPAVLGRGLQGIGAGGLVPATLALVADRWPPERRSLPARCGRCGAGGRRGARPAGRGGGARRGRLAGDLLAEPAARARTGRRECSSRPADGGPIRWAWSSPC